VKDGSLVQFAYQDPASFGADVVTVNNAQPA
jgi:hypothetical protein